MHRSYKEEDWSLQPNLKADRRRTPFQPASNSRSRKSRGKQTGFLTAPHRHARILIRRSKWLEYWHESTANSRTRCRLNNNKKHNLFPGMRSPVDLLELWTGELCPDVEVCFSSKNSASSPKYPFPPSVLPSETWWIDSSACPVWRQGTKFWSVQIHVFCWTRALKFVVHKTKLKCYLNNMFWCN